MDVDVKITKNVLSQKLLSRLHHLTRDGRQPSKTSYFHYSEAVVGMSNPIFQFDLEALDREQLAEELLAKGVLPNKPKNWSAHINLFPRGAFIPWHNDGKYIYTTTIYLNPEWKYDWGGAHLYAQGEAPFEKISCVFPEHNVGISYKPPLWHTTTITAIDARMRESLQIFVLEF
jgi:Rps23 Pro-64 3,4-dihydroxylase Tpa1-like proline 4-hydroxylase